MISIVDPNLIVRSKLNPVAEQSLHIENAGGKSEISEAFSIDFFIKNYNATNFIYETQVTYWAETSMIDYVCSINNVPTSVSVTRAMDFTKSNKSFDPYYLLKKKLYGLSVANNAMNNPSSKGILHIWCQSHNIAAQILDVLSNEDFSHLMMMTNTSISTTVIITVCNAPCIYTNKW